MKETSSMAFKTLLPLQFAQQPLIKWNINTFIYQRKECKCSFKSANKQHFYDIFPRFSLTRFALIGSTERRVSRPVRLSFSKAWPV